MELPSKSERVTFALSNEGPHAAIQKLSNIFKSSTHGPEVLITSTYAASAAPPRNTGEKFPAPPSPAD